MHDDDSQPMPQPVPLLSRKAKRRVGVIAIMAVIGLTSLAGRYWQLQARQAAMVDAVWRGDLAVVERCVEAGASVNYSRVTMAGSGYGMPVLTIAAQGGHAPVVRYLLERGARPNTKNGKFNPLILACWKRHYEVAKLLLEHHADPNARGEGTPLSAAESTGQSELVSLLLAYGAKPEPTRNRRAGSGE